MSEPTNARSGAASPPEDGGDALPAGTRLAEFEIREVLGVGGFGIVYRAWDDALQRDVALKEYMPVSLAGRGSGQRVTLRTSAHDENFALGLQSFVNEARLLARFDQPALVKVFRFWEGNGTAYMAMPLYKGRTLRQLRKERGAIGFDDAWMRALIEPLLGALETMHEAAVYHRDIAPDNILWCDNNRPVLLDFGAARLVLADRTQAVTAILKPQFAPIEQYAETQSMRQGPWTDLYALAGTCYFMLTGRAPLPATARVMGDELEPLASIAPAGCSQQLLQVLDWAMAVRPQDRPQSVAQFREALAGRIPAPGATIDLETVPDGYEKTIQATMHMAKTQRTPPPSTAPAPAPTPMRAPMRARDDDELETPERSVMLPPKSSSPLKTVLLLLVLIGAAAGAWTTRTQWMPLVGLQTATAPVADSASAPEASASAVAPLPLADAASATEPASAAASQAPASASNAAATFTPVPAPDPAAVAPEPEHVAEKPEHAKAAKDARKKALEARIAALKMPPPDLPPPLPSAAPANATPVQAAAKAAPEAAQAVASTATPVSHGLNWREVCSDQEPAKIAACIKKLCDSDLSLQRYPICKRIRRQEEQQTQRGTSE